MSDGDLAFQRDMDSIAILYTAAGSAAALAGNAIDNQPFIETGAGFIGAALLFLVLATIAGFKSGFYTKRQGKDR